MNSNGFLNKTSSALNKPLVQRCEEIEKIIEGSSTKDLHGFFPQLLGSIFGYGGSSDWGLQNYEHHSSEASVLQAFLSPEGPIFKLVDKLQADGYLRYEFFIHYLPMPTQRALAQGVIPTLYHNKVQASTPEKNQNVVSLNAFEYFLFHFAYYIVFQHKSKETSGNDYPYIHILEEYLDHFLPTDGSPIQTSGKCSPAVGSIGRTSTWQTPGLYNRSHYHQNQFTGLIRAGPSGLVNAPGLHHHGVLDHSSQETWRSEVFVQVLVEFWINQNTMESVTSNVLSHGQEYFMPSTDHVRVTRMLVKHVHTFVYSNRQDLHSQPVLNPTDDLRRNIIPHLLQKSLYCFLRHGFAHWPLDHSFRVILETWLSYIQPWRYAKGSGTNKGESVVTAGPHWKSFIMENFLFYTTLLVEFISRSCRFDLRSAKDAHLLLRGTKVFSSLGLADIIEEGEKHLLMHSGSMHPRSYSPGGLAAAASALRAHVAELEGPSYFYRPLFQRPGVDKIDELCSHVAIALTEATSDQQGRETLASAGGLVEWMKGILAGNFFDDDNDRKAQEHKLISYLSQATQNLSSLNKGGRDATDAGDKTVMWGSPGSLRHSARPTQTPGAQAVVPDSVETRRGLVPTTLGKYQMINGLRKFDVTYSGDPELQPIRSFENASLVRLLYRLSMFLNEKFGHTLERVCNGSAFFHSATCRLCPALKAANQSAIFRSSPMTRVQAPQGALFPRISLRFLASYRTWFCLFVFYAFCWILSLDSLLLLSIFILILSLLLLHHMTPAYEKDASYEKILL